jgi:aryl-alcohol dehydrogenase-like predicted oxidoreductase
MEYVALGRTGLQVSRLCLGCANFGGRTNAAEALRILEQALSDGVTFWDTANDYNGGRSEEIIGQALRRSGARNRVVLATKVGWPLGAGPNQRGAGRRHILEQVDASLRRLGTDWIDLYQIHRPDFATPSEETVAAMDQCIRAGKVRYWGTSTFPSWLMAELWWTAERGGWTKPVCEQAPYNLLDRRVECERIPFLQRYGWGLVTWAPLAGGILSGRYPRDALSRAPAGSRLERDPLQQARTSQRALDVARCMVELCRDLGVTAVGFAVAWVLAQPAVTAPIIGPGTLEQYQDYLNALEIKIPPDVLHRCDEWVPPGAAVADFHNNAGWLLQPP